MEPAAFYPRFQTGELGGAMDFFEWAGLYELYRNAQDNAAHRPELPAYPCHVHQGAEDNVLLYGPIHAEEMRK